MKKRHTFVLAVAIPLLILLAMIVKPMSTILYGKAILLQTHAVDPNDLFRGDYVSLAYTISDVPKSLLPASVRNAAKTNIKLYVILKQSGQFYVLDSVSQSKPRSGVYLMGRLSYYNQVSNTAHVDYTLDKYFVQQGSGQVLQQQSQRGELIGKAKVLNGYAILTGVEAQPNNK